MDSKTNIPIFAYDSDTYDHHYLGLNCTDIFEITLPRDGLTDVDIEKLKNLIDSKNALIRKSLGISQLTLNITKDMIGFPWLTTPRSLIEINAFALFITKLIQTARVQRHIDFNNNNAKTPKDDFRYFLLRLGLIGEEYRIARKVLLSNFTEADS